MDWRLLRDLMPFYYFSPSNAFTVPHVVRACQFTIDSNPFAFESIAFTSVCLFPARKKHWNDSKALPLCVAPICPIENEKVQNRFQNCESKRA